ncbi:MAG: bifunctional adenosylcobinamide kinase/adenosylcobinamide-phosphate guanylyltransferase [Anaeromassilibacillus sp.]
MSAFVRKGQGNMRRKPFYGGSSVSFHGGGIVVVSNEIFSDGTPYDPSTQAYIARLAHLNAALAQRADTVVEVVCGIPIVQKGREWLCT